MPPPYPPPPRIRRRFPTGLVIALSLLLGCCLCGSVGFLPLIGSVPATTEPSGHWGNPGPSGGAATAVLAASDAQNADAQNAVTLQPWGSTQNQFWVSVAAGDGYFALRDVATTTCLDAGTGTVGLSTCASVPTQQWSQPNLGTDPQGRTYLTLRTRSAGGCLTRTATDALRLAPCVAAPSATDAWRQLWWYYAT
jgi:hypothetical protein